MSNDNLRPPRRFTLRQPSTWRLRYNRPRRVYRDEPDETSPTDRYIEEEPDERLRPSLNYADENEFFAPDRYDQDYEDRREDITDDNTCTRTVHQKTMVNVPIAIKPFSFTGPTSTVCSSDPVIRNIRWTETKEQVCYVTVSQEICVEIPLHFGAKAHVGPSWVECDKPSADSCEDCENYRNCNHCDSDY
ncbi:MAG: hypothetical protein ACOX6I_07200 [Syntrophomonadaceae bacterium]|jgi:hypothetical protein